jgi:methyl-accepting chemotaxis protein
VEASGSGDGGVMDNVQKAIDDLRAAAEKATGDVRSNIDDAVARLRDASSEATKSAQDQVSNWRGTLEDATEDVRKELAKLAVRAQSSLDSLDEVAEEVNERRKSLGGGGS